jgi:hypothetical protein
MLPELRKRLGENRIKQKQRSKKNANSLAVLVAIKKPVKPVKIKNPSFLSVEHRMGQ